MSDANALPLEELAALPEYYHPTASPEGDRIAFYHDGSGRNQLYVMDVETADRTRVSDGQVPRDATDPIAWGPGGDRIYFHSDDGGSEQTDVHALGLDGEHEVVVEAEGQNVLQDVSPDGRYLLYLGTRSGQRNLHRHDLETGADERLTEYDDPVRGGSLGPAGERIAYGVNESENPDNLDVYVAAADGSDPRRLDVGDDGVETSFGDWSPNGSSILIEDESTGLRRAGIYDLDSGSVRWFGTNEYEERPHTFRPDGDEFLVLRLRDCGTLAVMYDVTTGDGRTLSLDDGAVSPVGGPFDGGFLRDGSVLLSYATTDTRRGLYRWDPETDDGSVMIEPEYGDLDPGGFVEAEHVTYQSTGTDATFGSEGEAFEIEGLLYDSGERPSPAVVHVHGGPHWRASRTFDTYAQFLVSRGYTVFQPNYRGSIGRSRAFETAIRGDWGGLEQEDVALAGRWLERRDWIDEDRIAVYGASYGGYSVYMQLVKHPEQWTTGIAWGGITDLPALFDAVMPHYRTIMRRQMGDPESNADLWVERSPLTHVENVERPILMIHGVNDARCPVDQARSFRRALEERGMQAGEAFVYEEFGDRGHRSTAVDGRIRGLELVADFLDDRL